MEAKLKDLEERVRDIELRQIRMLEFIERVNENSGRLGQLLVELASAITNGFK